MPILKEISPSEFDYFVEMSIRDYAEQNLKAGLLSKERSIYDASMEFKELLPDGKDTKDNYIYSLVDNDNTVGSIWISKRNNACTINHIYIYEEFQSKGYGRLLMQEIEVLAKSLGLNKIELHVLGHNEKAINLYKSLDYKTTNIIMSKKI